jgi:DNA-binding transcriptional LysR family regulator
MSLPRLRTFVEVYRQRSISAAARNLDLTQPAVSQHIAGLEAAIGHPLFVRSVHGVVPTAAADDLAAELGDKLDAAENALSSARARSADMAGAVRIVGHSDFVAEVVAPLLVPLLQAGIRVHLESGDREAVATALVNGHCDLGLSGYALDDRRLRSELIREEPLVAVAAPAVAARLLAAPDLAAALGSEPVLAYNLERPLVDDWLARNGLFRAPVSPAAIGQDLRALRRLVCQGFGWTVLPAYMCQAALGRSELAEIAPPVAATSNAYYLAWSPSALRQPRIAHARQTLIWGLRGAGVPA